MSERKMRKRPSLRLRGKRASAGSQVAEATATYGIGRELRAPSQPKLFDFGPNGGRNGAAFRDPAFMDNKTLPVHRWVPWIAGFSAGFVDDVLDSFLRGHGTERPAVVLDPFAGVGTTLVQAVLRGHNAIGFEINPYGALAARTKIRAAAVDLARLDAALDELRTASRLWRTTESATQAAPPPLKTRIPFFSKPVERQAIHALAFINRLRDQEIADLFRIAFGAVLVSVSNYTYEPSLGSRPAAGKPLVEDADVGAVLTAKLIQIRADIAWLRGEVIREGRLGSGRVFNEDFFTGAEHVETGSVDLMLTSPPYMNNYHYVRNTRPQLYWLDFITSPEQQKFLETHNFGKYWQTVRDSSPIGLEFEHRALATALEQLRQVRADKGAYGGLGWANYVATYFNDSHRFLAILHRVLRRRGVGVIVIGNSIIQGLEIKTERFLGEIAADLGLELEGIHLLRDKRVGASITTSSVRRGESSQATLYESAVVLRKR
ncbi:MAG: site-specific DNA-methyltransferase [Planctomycetes bacterium]|nr:site-specific DNA-methyltransferase [Planctomycetota bacterium]